MPDFSKINFNNTEYFIKDSLAREIVNTKQKQLISTTAAVDTIWVEDTVNNYYYQDVNISGITPDDTPWIDVQLSGDKTQMLAQLAQYNKILTIWPLTNKIRIFASEQTTIAINLTLKY